MSEVIELNNHRLLNGDATCKSDVDKLIGDYKVNLLLTDPPYGIDIVKIGGGKSEEKNHLPSIKGEREREQMGSICGYKLKPSKPFKNRNSRNTSKTRLQKQGGAIA